MTYDKGRSDCCKDICIIMNDEIKSYNDLIPIIKESKVPESIKNISTNDINHKIKAIELLKSDINGKIHCGCK